ncbi:hypothetical protein ARMSODRAFT_793854 [Armillaria solidipes]|uniref:Uncharacterized protein n=1 Tax=Armillaria solidipes TaxID=1076256 RepID=A0A2H3BLZ2_9AGAR|nr:hypothetical protein ARMSODRAFT_793854 [Armillaria solidipes]
MRRCRIPFAHDEDVDDGIRSQAYLVPSPALWCRSLPLGVSFLVIFAGWSADKWGRKTHHRWGYSSRIGLRRQHVGYSLPAVSYAVGIMNMTTPIYNSDIAPLRWLLARTSWTLFSIRCSPLSGGYIQLAPLRALRFIATLVLIEPPEDSRGLEDDSSMVALAV